MANSKEGFIFNPFPEIPYFYTSANRTNPALPSRKDTALFNHFEKYVLYNSRILALVEGGKLTLPFESEDRPELYLQGFRAIAEWALAANSTERRSKREAILILIKKDFPTGYDAVAYTLDAQNAPLNARRDEFQGLATALSGTIGLEIVYQVPQNVSLSFVLKRHGFTRTEQLEEHKEILRAVIGKAFKKRERNIFYGEDAGGARNAPFRVKRAEGFALTGSYVKADLYSNLCVGGFIERVKRPPTVEELNKLVSSGFHKKRTVGEPIDPKVTTFEVLDEFLEEGYQIEFESEHTYQPPTVDLSALLEHIYTNEDLAAYHQALDESILIRNRLVVIELMSMGIDASKIQENTNILANFGTAHDKIPTSLPHFLKGAIRSITKQEWKPTEEDLREFYEIRYGKGSFDKDKPH